MREFGSEFPAVLLSDGYFASFEKHGHCTWIRSGREALFLIALSVKPETFSPILLMPAYCCNSMSDPFSKAGWTVEYYSLKDDLSADLDSLAKMMNDLHPAAALTMNYFGCASTWETVACIKSISPACLVVEDFSHCTFSFEQIVNPDVDYYVSSIRKSVGICDGAVIVSHCPIDESLIVGRETDFVRKRMENQRLKGLYSFTKSPEQKEQFYPGLKFQEVVLDHFTEVHRISDEGMEMLTCLNGEQIRYARQKNMEHLLSALGGKIETVPGIEECLSGAPFSMPILVDDRDMVQRQMANRGVYAPVLWPICDAARSVCPVSAKMADRMLSLPVDQRYDFDDIDDIARIVIAICCSH